MLLKEYNLRGRVEKMEKERRKIEIFTFKFRKYDSPIGYI